MKDIVITPRRIKRELVVFLVCFVAAILLNVFAIATKGTEWSELFTQLHTTLALAVVLYIIVGVVRLLVALIRRLVVR